MAKLQESVQVIPRLRTVTVILKNSLWVLRAVTVILKNTLWLVEKRGRSAVYKVHPLGKMQNPKTCMVGAGGAQTLNLRHRTVDSPNFHT